MNPDQSDKAAHCVHQVSLTINGAGGQTNKLTDVGSAFIIGLKPADEHEPSDQSKRTGVIVTCNHVLPGGSSGPNPITRPQARRTYPD